MPVRTGGRMIQSMTGFASASGSTEAADWIWELRSVNGKGLDLRLRLPPGHDHLEARLKELAAAQLKRGNIQASLQLDHKGVSAVPALNEDAFDAAVAMVRKAAQRSNMPMPGLDAVLAIRGVVDFATPQTDEAAQEALEAAICDTFEEAVSALAKARASEGRSIAKVVAAHVDAIEAITQRVSADPSRTPEAIRARLAANVDALMDTGGKFDSDRLHAEAAILATKADLQEEIDRLEAHIAAARDLLGSDGAIGRRLDFLAQEFNRECNTICSKSNAPAVTAAGLEMKVVIDQFREQIQNLQ